MEKKAKSYPAEQQEYRGHGLAEVTLQTADLEPRIENGNVILQLPINEFSGRALEDLVISALPDASRAERLRLSDEVAELIFSKTVMHFLSRRIG